MTEIEARDIGDIWFQQDDATSHTSHQSMDLLREHFGEQIISRFRPVDWPPRSCDITPLDFFLWGYVKYKVYADNSASIQALEQMQMLGAKITSRNDRTSHRKLDSTDGPSET